MTPYSSTLAWKIPWTEEPGRLQSMRSLGVGHDGATSLSLFTFMHWRRKWQPTSVFSPGESQGRGSLVGCCLWGRTESDTTEATWQQQQQQPVLHFASVWAFSHLFKCSPTVFPFYKLRLQHGLPEVTQLVANIAGNKVKHLDPSLALAASSEIHSAWVFSDK